MVLFGKYLLSCGMLTRPQLLEATQTQVVFGGRLGTNLVELGYLQIDELEHHLGRHLGLPVAPTEWLEDPGPEALSLVSAELVARNGIFPLALEDRTLHLAMSDPRNPHQVDESAFATGLRVQPYVVSELRMKGLLERYYGIRSETRSIDMGPEFKLGRHIAERAEEAANREPAEFADEERDGAVDALADQDLIDEASFSALHSDWQSNRSGSRGMEEPARMPDSVPAASNVASESDRVPCDPVVTEEVLNRLQMELDPRGAALAAVTLESALANAMHRNDIGRLALQLARLFAGAAALFVVRDGLISGFRGDGEAITPNIDGVLIPTSSETIFAAPATGGQQWRGRPPTTGISDRVLKALGRREVFEALVLPITIGGIVINLLYVDNKDERISETAVAALGALCSCVSKAYERLIIEGKERYA